MKLFINSITILLEFSTYILFKAFYAHISTVLMNKYVLLRFVGEKKCLFASLNVIWYPKSSVIKLKRKAKCTIKNIFDWLGVIYIWNLIFSFFFPRGCFLFSSFNLDIFLLLGSYFRRLWSFDMTPFIFISWILVLLSLSFIFCTFFYLVIIL